MLEIVETLDISPKKLSPSLCDGVVEQQGGESIIPLVTNELMEETTLCTFILEMCDDPQWTKINIQTEIENLLSSKPKIGLSNDFVQNLYDNLAFDFEF